MIEEEEEFEYDVVYRGTKEQLYAFLYPLTGPDNPIFDHLDLRHTHFQPEQRHFEITYDLKDFENIDKQKEQVVYRSSLAPNSSNYFYSVYQPEQKWFIWQNVHNFVEMRPRNREMAQDKEKEISRRQGMVELETISFDSSANKGKEIIEDTALHEVKENWEVSREEYLAHLAK